MHWCADETLAVMSMIPIIGAAFKRAHTWWHKKFNHKCHEGGCGSSHVDHVFDRSWIYALALPLEEETKIEALGIVTPEGLLDLLHHRRDEMDIYLGDRAVDYLLLELTMPEYYKKNE